MQINPIPTLENLGGKGYHLNLLKEICTVPSFFVIYLDSLEEIEDQKIQQEILEYYEKSKFEMVSVRSSATVEDGAKSSFAGMFESVLNANKEGLIQAVREVVNSIKGDRVVEYCKLKDIDQSKVGMRVVVQKMVNSRVSGVCFTKTPSAEELITIEACFGLGEALVSGAVTPDNYAVNRNTLNIENTLIGYQKTMLKQNGYEEVPFHKRNSKKLTNEEIEELSKVALNIEKSLSFTAGDIEWSFEGNRLYVLQARVYTGIE